MLLIEYRVCLPLSVEEYQVAQLYMIMKKSRKESESAGSRVEILSNEPYENGPGGTSGQYTKKHYHIGERLPRWATSIITKPVLEEEAWNAYPFTKTQYTCYKAPSMLKDNFSLSIETKYLNDIGNSENVFNLSDSELRQRRVYHLDMINDYKDVYVEEEDPLTFTSEKTGRGPLEKTWIRDRKGSKEILCAYKLCRIRFDNYFFGHKVENDLIHERALKKLLIHSHRQAWCWQDEYYGLAMEDIRKLEAEAAEELKNRFAQLEEDDETLITLRSHLKSSERNGSIVGSSGSKKKKSSRDYGRRISMDRKDSLSPKSTPAMTLTSNHVTSDSNIQDSESPLSSRIAKDETTSPMSIAKPIRAETETASDIDQIPEKFSATPSDGELSSQSFGDSDEEGFGDDDDEDDEEETGDDEFFDALSQQVYNSTLILDYNEYDQSNEGEGCFELEKSIEETPNVNNEVVTKNVLLLIAADSVYKSDKTDFVYYEQAFQKNVNEIMRKFFHTSPTTTVLKSFHLPKNLLENLQNHVIEISGKNVRVKSKIAHDEKSWRAKIVNSVAMSTTALLLPKQSNYQEILSQMGNALDDCVENLRTHFGHYVELEISVVCDNLGSILFHDLLTRFSSPYHGSKSTIADLGFRISNAYYLGSSLGYLLSVYGVGDKSKLTFPLYNLFFAEDNCAARLEPVLLCHSENEDGDNSTSNSMLPFKLTSYRDLNYYVGDHRQRKLDVFPDVRGRSDLQLWSGHSTEDQKTVELITKISGTHALYWDSFDVVFFVLSNFSSHSVASRGDELLQSGGSYVDAVDEEMNSTLYRDCSTIEASLTMSTASNTLQRRKFDHKSSARKSKSFPPLHVLNDVAITVGNEAMITGRFGYRVGVFVSKLSSETVELEMKSERGDGEDSDDCWSSIGQIKTGIKGRIMYNYTLAKGLSIGLYSVRAVCPGDLSRARSTLCVLPPEGVQAVVFSIDGTFADSVSITGSNSKLRNSSVELVRFWCALGYLAVYASARPNIMKERVKSWLDAHGFPPSLCLFVEGLSTPEKNMVKKGNMLKQLKENMNISYYAAYGSQKDLTMYSKLNISPERIFIFPDRLTTTARSRIGSTSSQNSCETISKNGIAAHVSNLRIKSQELMAEAPLHFSMQFSRKIKGSSSFVCIDEDSCAALPEDSLKVSLVTKSPRLKGKFFETISSMAKRETVVSLPESRQSKSEVKQNLKKTMTCDS